MKVCIYGAGAIGGHLATRLIASGSAEVSVIARGPHLMAIRERGLVLRSDGRELSGRPVAATDDPATLPLQDIVVVTLKAYALASVARPVAALLAPNGVAVFAANGLPWWWNHGLGSGGALELLDPDGALWRGLGAQRVLGAVVNSANAVVEPGVIVNTGGGRRWTIGEPDNSRSERVQVIVDLLAAADIDSVLSTDIRRDIFRKLCVNISSNPLAALTRLTSRDGAQVPGLDEVGIAMIEEALAVGVACGVDLRGAVDPDAIVRPRGGRSPGRSSMLQDVDAGRPIEVEAIVGQVQAFGREKGVPTPTIDVVLALARGLDLSLRMAG